LNGRTVPKLGGPIALREITALFSTRIRRNARTHAIQQAFGISPEDLKVDVLRGVSLTVEPGNVVVVTGPSGAGKTVLLDVIAGTLRTGLSLGGSVRRPRNIKPGYLRPILSKQSLIEIFGHPNVEAGIRALSLVGLSDAYLYLRRFSELSAGQQYRAMLADLVRRKCNLAIIDEFCSTLDPVTAHTVAASLSKLARTAGLTAVVAAPHTNLFLQALQPDKVVTLSSFGKATVKILRK
jgi:ABC-type ATPase with predicted acetyltransferase domain